MLPRTKIFERLDPPGTVPELAPEPITEAEKFGFLD
jgi:hypothetical protein